MTLITVSKPRGFAKTSMRPRYGLSLNRTGAFTSSSDANVTGALELNSFPAPPVAISSRVGTLEREARRMLPEDAIFGAIEFRLAGVDDCRAASFTGFEGNATAGFAVDT